MKTLILVLASLMWATVGFAQGQYKIQTGDTLSVEVVEDPSLNRNVLVLPGGDVSFPFAGSVPAAGMTTGQVASEIAKAIAPNYATTPTVFVSVRALSGPATASSSGGTGPSINVYMMGEIGSPGEKSLARGTTLIQALATTGGFSKFAATKRIVLRRIDPRTGQETVSRINYKAIADGAAGGTDVVLKDGDVIIVPERRLFE